jgi:hypothetical protein
MKIPTKKILRELDSWKHRADEHELKAIDKFRDMIVDLDEHERIKHDAGEAGMNAIKKSINR